MTQREPRRSQVLGLLNGNDLFVQQKERDLYKRSSIVSALVVVIMLASVAAASAQLGQRRHRFGNCDK